MSVDAAYTVMSLKGVVTADVEHRQLYNRCLAVRIYCYNCCDSVEPTIALFESFSVTLEREYTAHGMWVMAELVANARSLLLLILT